MVCMSQLYPGDKKLRRHTQEVEKREDYASEESCWNHFLKKTEGLELPSY